MTARLLAALAFVACVASAPRATAQEAPLHLVVLHKADASAGLYDAATGERLARMATGVGPHEVAVSPDGRTAVVADYGDQHTVGATLTVLDLAARTPVRTVPLGRYTRPHGIAWLADDRVAVTAERDSAVVLVDVAAGRVVGAAPTGQGASHMLALAPDARVAFTANILSGTVSRVDLAASRTDGTAEVGPYAEAVAVRPGGREVWAASQQSGRIAVLDAATLAEAGTAQVGGRPIRIAFTPDGALVLVTAVEAGRLVLLDAGTRAEVGAVDFGAGALPIGIAVAPDGGHAYVALAGADRVAVVDLAARTVVREIATGPVPDGIAVVPVAR